MDGQLSLFLSLVMAEVEGEERQRGKQRNTCNSPPHSGSSLPAGLHQGFEPRSLSMLVYTLKQITQLCTAQSLPSFLRRIQTYLENKWGLNSTKLLPHS